MLYYVSDELIMRHILVSVFTEDRRYDAEFRKRGGVIWRSISQGHWTGITQFDRSYHW